VSDSRRGAALAVVGHAYTELRKEFLTRTLRSSVRRRRGHLWLVLATVAGVLAAAAPAQAVPFVYVTNATSANVSQYDAAGGALAPLSPPTVGAGIGPPHSVAATHDGTSAYVSTSELYGTPEIEAMILEYSIEPGGSLTLRSSAPLPRTPIRARSRPVPTVAACTCSTPPALAR
jgi:hypothetical protein